MDDLRIVEDTEEEDPLAFEYGIGVFEVFEGLKRFKLELKR